MKQLARPRLFEAESSDEAEMGYIRFTFLSQLWIASRVLSCLSLGQWAIYLPQALSWWHGSCQTHAKPRASPSSRSGGLPLGVGQGPPSGKWIFNSTMLLQWTPQSTWKPHSVIGSSHTAKFLHLSKKGTYVPWRTLCCPSPGVDVVVHSKQLLCRCQHTWER